MMSNGVNYLETAKAQISQINGEHSVEYVKAFALAAIANALIAIAKKVTKND